MKILYTILLHIALLFDVAIGHCDPRVLGYDYLAAQQRNFSVQEAIKYMPSNSALGTLDVTFGSDLAPIRALLGSGRFSHYRLHLVNGPGLRNSVQEKHEITYGYNIRSFDSALRTNKPAIINNIKARTAIYRSLSAEFPSVKFYLSPLLEHDVSEGAWRNAANAVLSIWPEVRLVNNPMSGWNGSYKGSILERHGAKPGSAAISSLDGEDATDINVPEWLKRTAANKITYVWSRSYNCRHQGNFVPPSKRTSCPKPYQFEELAHIPDARPTAPSRVPAGCAKVKPLAAPSIWKPMSEDKGNGDPRANLPVLLIPFQPKLPVTVIGMVGQPVGTLGYYGVFQGDLNRYYSGYGGGSKKGGYQLEKEATKQGSPYVWAKQGKTCVGPFISGRRAGSYR